MGSRTRRPSSRRQLVGWKFENTMPGTCAIAPGLGIGTEGCSHYDQPILGEASTDQAAIRARVDPNGDVELLLDEIYQAVDTRDIADIAVAELLRRDRAVAALPQVTLDVVGPDVLTGASAAKIWSSALGREVTYAGDDVAAFEAQMASFGPAWLAYDMRLMMAGIQQFGMRSAEGAVDRLQAMLGRPLRTYADFVKEAIAAV